MLRPKRPCRSHNANNLSLERDRAVSDALAESAIHTWHEADSVDAVVRRMEDNIIQLKQHANKLRWDANYFHRLSEMLKEAV